MAIRMTGMMSGLDTDSIIKELMSAQSIKKTKVENKKTKLEWTMDKWKGLNSKLLSFYKGSLNSVKTSGNYRAKNVTSSDESIVTAKSDSTGASGSHTIDVINLASVQSVTGSQLTSPVTGSTKLRDLVKNAAGESIGFKNETIEITVGTGSNAVTKTLTVGDSTTINDFVNTLQEAGLNAKFDSDQQRFFISSKDSGKDNKFSIKSVREDTSILEKKDALLQAVGPENSSVVNDFYNNYASANDLLNEKKSLYDSITITSSSTEEEKAKKVKAYDEWKAAEKNITDLKKNLVSFVKDNVTADIKETVSAEAAQEYINSLDPASDEYRTVIDAVDRMYYNYNPDGTMVNPPSFKQEIKDAATSYVEAEKRQEAVDYVNNLIANGATYVSEEARQQAVTDQYNAIYGNKTDTEKAGMIQAKINEMYTESKDSAFESLGANYLSTDAGIAKVNEKMEAKAPEIAAKAAAAESAINSYVNAAHPAPGTSVPAATATDSLNKLGLANITFDSSGAVNSDISGIDYKAAADAQIKFDGALLNSTKNNFTAAGITFDIKNVGTAALSVSNNIDETYETVKKFIKDYNDVLTEMSTAYYAKSAKGYEPLTSEQKKEMSDDEIDKWQKKIQDASLRRDSTLGGLMNTMRTALQTSVEVDGKRYSLASLGITTSDDWTERGLLHLQGDKDDDYMPNASNKLKKMLEEDPELVEKIITGVTSNLYDTMQKKMSTSTLSSALTFYNDKVMTKQVDDYKDEIKNWEDKLTEMEDKYYKQFSAMETALARLSSQSSALSGLMGS